MSGGSYNYASDASDLDDVVSKRFDLDAMCERLYGRTDLGDLGTDTDDVAADLEGLLRYTDLVSRRVEARLRRLSPVLHAIEWYDSGDWSKEQVAQALAKYRGEA